MKTDSFVMDAKNPILAADVKYAIFKAMERATELDAESISVDAEAGRVTLRGTVSSWAERDEAERAAWNTPGVLNVRNEIRVASPPG